MSGALRSLLVCVAAAVAAAGIALAVLLMPWFTRAGIEAAGAPALSDLGRRSAYEAAETARRYVAGRTDVLPATVAGRPGFDDAAASHLADVRGVVTAARWVGVAALAGLWSLVAHAVAHGTQLELARGLRWAGRTLVAAAGVAALAGAADFGAAFVAFHELLFPKGGWLFPADALLIRLFPERFWALAGASFVALLAAGGAVLLWAARFVRTLFDDRLLDTARRPVGD